MRTILKIAFLLLLPMCSNAQQSLPDSLKNALQHAADGPVRYRISRDIYSIYEESNRDSALYYAEQGLLIAQRCHHKIAESVSLSNKAYQLMQLGRFADALQCLQQAFAIAEDQQTEKEPYWDVSTLGFKGNTRLLALSYAHHIFAVLMLRTGNTAQQIIHFKEAGRIGTEIGYLPRMILANMNLGQSYVSINKLDSALLYEKEAERLQSHSDFEKYRCHINMILGDIYNASGQAPLALQYYYSGLTDAIKWNNLGILSRIYLRLSKYHLAAGNKDSALYYSKQNLSALQSMGAASGSETNIGIGYEYMYLSYQLNGQFDSAFKYQSLAMIAKDSLNKIKITTLTEFQNLTFSEQLRLQNLAKEKRLYQSRVRTYTLLVGLGIFLLIALLLFRNNRQKQKTNKMLEKTLVDLKSTQSQLIQSEKMASLGELTAGIAHEIQNPLNFVNNFSEVNNELIEELQEERNKEQGTRNEELQTELLNDIKQNLEKINHHGKRADAIVKGMLQHSRSSSGQKEPTDINALADEYLRLAYHGLRAKDKSFNATLKTDYDETIGNIDIIPQDIGRVILNLITNAFYAVQQKQKETVAQGLTTLYEPAVSVSTKRINNKVEIKVTDNGNGIPKNIIDKIFQPFFTTKPTGQGTGLGLSLSYDIIKAHGGELKVETKEAGPDDPVERGGEQPGSTFTIYLPGQYNP